MSLYEFDDNKYTRWYFSIIKKSLESEYAHRRTQTKNVYTERHHIVPRALGGDDSNENVVRMSARAHFVCHRLLTKMTSGKAKSSMIFALSCMTSSKRYAISSVTYERIRREFSVMISQQNKGKKNPFSAEHLANIRIANQARIGSKASIETRAKMSKAGKRRPPNNKGKKFSDVARANISKAMKNRAPFTQSHREKIGNAKRGVPIYVERDITILKMFDDDIDKSEIAVQVGVTTKVVLEVNRKRNRGFYSKFYTVSATLKRTEDSIK